MSSRHEPDDDYSLPYENLVIYKYASVTHYRKYHYLERKKRIRENVSNSFFTPCSFLLTAFC